MFLIELVETIIKMPHPISLIDAVHIVRKALRG